MISKDMERFDADMNGNEELVAKFEETCVRLSKEVEGCSESELMAKAANELGYQIKAEDLELNIAGREPLDLDELAAVSGGKGAFEKIGGEDEKGHDAWCLTLWHCNAITLHTEHKTNRRVACWTDHNCAMNYYSGCYNDWKPDQKPLPDNPNKK